MQNTRNHGKTFRYEGPGECPYQVAAALWRLQCDKINGVLKNQTFARYHIWNQHTMEPTYHGCFCCAGVRIVMKPDYHLQMALLSRSINSFLRSEFVALLFGIELYFRQGASAERETERWSTHSKLRTPQVMVAPSSQAWMRDPYQQASNYLNTAFRISSAKHTVCIFHRFNWMVTRTTESYCSPRFLKGIWLFPSSEIRNTQVW